MKASVLFCEFPGYLYSTMPDAADWVRETMWKAKQDSRFHRVEHARFVGTPITMLRNHALKTAVQGNFDFCLMLDSDMAPDRNDRKVKSDKPFWETTVNFLFSHYSVPTMVFAPYVGSPPWENCYVFRWRQKESHCPQHLWMLDGYTREEAACMSGIQRCAAGPTGLIMIDTRVLKYVPPPWFYYHYSDGDYEAEKDMTEDVAFTRDVSLAPALDLGLPLGLPIYCNWDAWACHWKMKACGKPIIVENDYISSAYRHAVKTDFASKNKFRIVGTTPYDPPVVVTGSAVGHSPRQFIDAIDEHGPALCLLNGEDRGPKTDACYSKESLPPTEGCERQDCPGAPDGALSAVA